MTSKEFVIWLKGFAAAANSYNITPKQWDVIQETLEQVNDSETHYSPAYSTKNSNATTEINLIKS